MGLRILQGRGGAPPTVKEGKLSGPTWWVRTRQMKEYNDFYTRSGTEQIFHRL